MFPSVKFFKTIKTMIRLVVIFIVFAQPLLAQIVTEGHIIYEHKINLHAKIPPDRNDLLSMIPEFQTYEKELFFTREESLYRKVKDNSQGRGRGFRMDFGSSGLFYYNFPEKEKVVQQDIVTETYLVRDSLDVYPWKLRGEMKPILGYMCQLAYYESQEDSTYVVAWFSPEIPVGVGPENYRGLPGAILEIDVNFGETMMEAKAINPGPVDEKIITPPSKGKKVDQETFNAKNKEVMETMRKRFGGG